MVQNVSYAKIEKNTAQSVYKDIFICECVCVSFLFAPINYFKISCLKQHKFILWFYRLDVQYKISVKIELLPGLCSLLEFLVEHTFPYHFHLLEGTHISWLMILFLCI